MNMIKRFIAIAALVILASASSFAQGVRPEGFKIPVRVATTANITLSGTQTIARVS